jgi:hypothetical protein
MLTGPEGRGRQQAGARTLPPLPTLLRACPAPTSSQPPRRPRRRLPLSPPPKLHHLGAIGWCAWLFTLIAAGLLAYINTALVFIARSVTAGGAARPLAARGAFWARHSALLLPLIKLLLFCLSFVASNSV